MANRLSRSVNGTPVRVAVGCAVSMAVNHAPVCAPCQSAGAYSDFGAVNCTPAAPGYYADGVLRQEECAPGYYADEAQMTACKLCSEGMYANEMQSQECKVGVLVRICVSAF